MAEFQKTEVEEKTYLIFVLMVQLKRAPINRPGKQLLQCIHGLYLKKVDNCQCLMNIYTVTSVNYACVTSVSQNSTFHEWRKEQNVKTIQLNKAKTKTNLPDITCQNNDLADNWPNCITPILVKLREQRSDIDVIATVK